MLRKNIFFAFSILLAITGTAQNNEHNRFVSLSYGHIIGGIAPGNIVHEQTSYIHGSTVIADIEPWNITQNISAGIYIGGGIGAFRKTGTSLIISIPAFRFGISTRWHLLQYMCTTPSNHWDISVGGNIGSYWSRYAQLNIEYAATISATYYPINHWGCFIEYGWGRLLYGQSGNDYINLGNTLIKAGVSYMW